MKLMRWNIRCITFVQFSVEYTSKLQMRVGHYFKLFAGLRSVKSMVCTWCNAYLSKVKLQSWTNTYFLSILTSTSSCDVAYNVMYVYVHENLVPVHMSPQLANFSSWDIILCACFEELYAFIIAISREMTGGRPPCTRIWITTKHILSGYQYNHLFCTTLQVILLE